MARLERKDQRKRQKPTGASVSNGNGSYADKVRGVLGKPSEGSEATMEFFGKLFGLTATIISAMILLIIVALLAQTGQLDDVVGVFLQILLIPVQVVRVFVSIVQAAVEGGIFGGA